MAATTRRPVCRTAIASRSRLLNATTGSSSVAAMVLAVAIPTLRPLKSPGPLSTTTAVMSSAAASAERRQNSIAGATNSACA